MVIDALVHQDPPRRVEGEELAANAALRDAGTHGTLPLRRNHDLSSNIGKKLAQLFE